MPRRTPHLTSSAAAAASSSSAPNGDFDDQAWGIESDDDDFVSRVAPRTNVPRSLKSSSRFSSYLSQPTSQPHVSLSRTSTSSKTATAIAVPSRSSTALAMPTSILAASPSVDQLCTATDLHSHPGFNALTSGEPSSLQSNSSIRGTSWTIVDSVARASPVVTRTEAPIVGSPPTDIAVELNREGSGTGSGSGFQLVASDDAPRTASPDGDGAKGGHLETGVDSEPRDQTRSDSDGEAEEIDLDIGKPVCRRSLGKRKGKLGKMEAELLTKAIKPDLGELVSDPTQALSRLSLCWTSLPPSDTPAAEGAYAPSSATHERTPSGIARSADTGFTFDPVAAAGDGLIMAGPSFADAEPTERNGVVTSIYGSIVPVTTPGGIASALPTRKRSIRSSRRRQQLLACLNKPSIDISVLRSLAWAGVPDELRPVVWQLLLGYLPTVAAVRAQTLSRKRAEYAAGVRLAFAKGTGSLDQAIWHQIHIDVPRTNPGIRLWQRESTQRALERILYVWAIRHPASGYVQGINDLATPFFEVFLSAYVDSDPEMYDVSLLPPEALEALEADTFWCLSKLLDGIQDNYIFAQPGIQRQVRRMGELVARIDAPLHSHLQEQGVEYMQFAFRWMNCLLMREMSVRNIIRMWDTYLAEGQDAFSDFHLYVCSVFLHKWSRELMKMEFQGIIMYLQSLPTQGWSDKDAEMLLSEAFMYKTLFGNTAHLNK